MSEPDWSQAIPPVTDSDDVTITPRGEARDYMMALSEGMQMRKSWQHAARLLLDPAAPPDAVSEQLRLALFLDMRLATTS